MILQSFGDEFSLPKRVTVTPGMPGNTLKKATEEDVQPPEETTYFHKGVGKLIHIIRWSMPEVHNFVGYMS